MTPVCHGCQDVTRRLVEALEAQLDEARREIERLRGQVADYDQQYRTAVDRRVAAEAERDQARAALVAVVEVSAARLVMTSAGTQEFRDGYAAGVAALAQAQNDALRAALTPTTGTEQQS